MIPGGLLYCCYDDKVYDYTKKIYQMMSLHSVVILALIRTPCLIGPSRRIDTCLYEADTVS